MKAKTRGFSKIFVLEDANEVINAIKDEEEWSINTVILYINKISSDFDRVEFFLLLFLGSLIR